MLKRLKWLLTCVFFLSSLSGYAQTHIIRMVTMDTGVPSYEPDYLLIQSGDTVIWINVDRDVSHNVVAVPNGIPIGADLFGSPLLDALGMEWSHQFSKLGTYHYHCHPHVSKGMKGMIVVGRESFQSEIRTGSGAGHSHHH